ASRFPRRRVRDAPVQMSLVSQSQISSRTIPATFVIANDSSLIHRQQIDLVGKPRVYPLEIGPAHLYCRLGTAQAQKEPLLLEDSRINNDPYMFIEPERIRIPRFS